MKLIIFTDGGCHWEGTRDSSPAACAFVAYKSSGGLAWDDYVGSQSEQLFGSNNTAEYRGLGLAALALPILLKQDVFDQIEFRSDSKLVVFQMIGSWKINLLVFQELVDTCHSLIQLANIPYSFVHIAREHNKEADALCGRALKGDVKEDVLASITLPPSRPSLGQLFLAGKLTGAKPMRVDKEGFGLCDQCKCRLAGCHCRSQEDKDGLADQLRERLQEVGEQSHAWV
jgi:ribonuclease HI